MQHLAAQRHNRDGIRARPAFLGHREVAHDIGVAKAGIEHRSQFLAAGHSVARIAKELGAIHVRQAGVRFSCELWRPLQPEQQRTLGAALAQPVRRA